VLEWLGLRRRARVTVPTVTPRNETVEIARIELAELAPAPEIYLARVSYLALVLFENLGRAVMEAPTTDAKSALGGAAEEMLSLHQELVAELRRYVDDPVAAMDPHHGTFDDYQVRTRGADYAEILVTCYLTTGFLLDFYAGLAAGLPEPLSGRVTTLLRVEKGPSEVVRLLREAIDPSPRLASRLAVWGRRLIGDTILLARDALERDGVLPKEERTEPAFHELVAAHTRRMDALGLTA